MATNLSLDPELIERARRGQKRIVDLMGRLEWDESFDYKVERSRR